MARTLLRSGASVLPTVLETLPHAKPNLARVFFMTANFRNRIEASHSRISHVSETLSNVPLREGGWNRKQILGHLIDSVIHNHVRFVRAATQGHVEDIGYKQEELVGLHAYGELRWTALLEEWLSRNRLLARAVERMTLEQLSAPCRLEHSPQMALEAWIESYLEHLEEHIGQIASKPDNR